MNKFVKLWLHVKLKRTGKNRKIRQGTKEYDCLWSLNRIAVDPKNEFLGKTKGKILGIFVHNYKIFLGQF